MILMYVYVGSPQEADHIANMIMQERLANHIHISYDQQTCIWENGHQTTLNESSLQIKTKALLYADIERAIKGMGLASPPRIFSVPITQIDFSYHEFLKSGLIKSE